MAFSVRWLGQGGFLLNLGEKKLAIDPYLSDSVASSDGFHRLIPVPIAPEALSCDLLVSTHDHMDHLDPETVRKTDLPLYAGPTSCIEHFKKLGIASEKLRTLNTADIIHLGDARIMALFARHTPDSIGLMVDYEGVRLYFTADTEYDPRLKDASLLKIDVLFTCINGKLGNMNARQAAQLAGEINCRLAVPMHYGMFSENTEDPAVFAGDMKETGIPVFIMEPDTEYDVSDLLRQAR